MTPVATRRTLYLRELRPDCVEEYRRAHDEIWPELVALYKSAGIVDVSCFLCGSSLAVMVETEKSFTPEAEVALAHHSVERRWQDLMRTFNHPELDTRTFTEIYRQSQR